MIKKFYIYLRSGWEVPNMIMWESQDQEISSSKWVHRDHAGSSLGLEYFTMKINQHIVTWSYESEIARISLRKKMNSRSLTITWILKWSQDLSKSREFWNAVEMSQDLNINYEKFKKYSMKRFFFFLMSTTRLELRHLWYTLRWW